MPTIEKLIAEEKVEKQMAIAEESIKKATEQVKMFDKEGALQQVRPISS